jgi:hypothetical protein
VSDSASADAHRKGSSFFIIISPQSMISHGPPGAGASFFTLCARSFEPGDSIPALPKGYLKKIKILPLGFF